MRLKVRRGIKSLMLSLITVAVVLALPGFAAQVRVNPSSPELGNTLSVVLESAGSPNPPTVSWQGKTYPMFAIGPNRMRALLPTTPLDQPGTKSLQVNDGTQVQNLTVQLRDRDFPTQSIWLPPDKEELQGTDHEFDRVDAFKALVTPEKYWKGPFLRPNSGEITTIYGVRRYYNGDFAEDYYHRGVDYAGAMGSPVIAPAAGRIALVGRESEGFQIHGNVIGLDHGQGVGSILMHLSRIDVKEGDFVQAGQVIGAVGSSGASTGPHLHWGLYVQGQSVDPVPWRYTAID
ncbi:M23 family metallopeptidase [Planktothrix sp. FACHB-1365]|uniref:M23 family metallopeptidase n=1 Tax=Planktothrix sp. FACHB-1365 TaxID=2692855 RepID=UPI001689DD0E|nr:M23 family metallopeptidase [Planktothrix sp. FACHB-1365]MBD2482937.1 M23 family metallopeptidase [Planktothrix sp. FACHB-1365]